ncbi:MAG: DUF6444 domain-containing protein [Wolbachia sp.]
MTTVLQKEIVAENGNLKEEIKALITENDSLKAKIIELEDKLGLNSQNSSLPPSRDIYRKKGKKKSDKNPGGQPGHKAHKRELMAADEVVSCTIGKICMCGSKVVLEDEIVHQKVELPEIKPIVTEYSSSHNTLYGFPFSLSSFIWLLYNLNNNSICHLTL